MRPEDVEQRLRALKGGLESGAITEEEFEAEIESFLFQDELGGYWTIGAQTEKWYHHEDGEWVRAAPPSGLEQAEHSMDRPQEPSADRGSIPSRVLRRPAVIAVAALLFVSCLVTVAVASYQYGRMSVMSPLATSTPAETLASPSTTAMPVASPTGRGELTPAVEVASPTLSPTVERSTPTTPPQPSPTPTTAASPTPTARYPAPGLLGPQEGSQFGPGYEALLEWELVDQLDERDYYHVEVCWNGCASPDEFHGHYLRSSSYVFPGWIYRGRAIDDTYHWHVTVRRQVGDAPAGPDDPATSPTSDTWKFLLPRE
ncbi:MAG: hypothetical protein OEV76_06110 [Anaerolineae bacterium]|nr:hypothetical protein [Anaerolineae bacterium]